MIFATLALSISAISQFLADIIIETLSWSNVIPKIDFRIDFVSLTAISALLAYHALQGIRRSDLELTQDAIQVSALVETCLIIGDIIFLNSHQFMGYEWLIRMPFLILTSFNLLMICYITWKLNLFAFTKYISICNIFSKQT